MTVRTKELARASRSTTGQSLLFTVPADRTVIVKEVVLLHTGGISSDVEVRARRPTGAPIDIAFVIEAFSGFAVRRHERWTVLEPGDQAILHVAAITGSGALVSVMLSGTELVGVA